MDASGPGRRVVLLTDGKRGHENQSRVLSRMLGDPAPIVMQLRERVRNGGLAELLLRLKLRLTGREGFSQSRAAELVQQHLHPADHVAFRQFAYQVKAEPDQLNLFTVSTGTPPATFNLICAIMLGARAVVNMTPSLLPLEHFDLCLLPAHDVAESAELPGHVLLSPLALGYHDEQAAQLLAGGLCAQHGLSREGHYWGVSVGGPSKACPWIGDRILDELAAVHGLARQAGARLLVSTSRRTPEYCRTWLTRHYVPSDVVAYYLDATEDPLNPLPAFYELAARMFVSGDSFSMVSEAVQAGQRPVVLRTQPGSVKGKLGRALGYLEAEQLAVVANDVVELSDRIGLLPAGRAAPNLQYQQLKQQVHAQLSVQPQ